MSDNRSRWVALCIGTILSLPLLPGVATGQAWVPERGQGYFTTSYNYIDASGHLGGNGTRVAEAASIDQNIFFSFDYGLTDKLAITASIPVVIDRYADTNPPSAVLKDLFDQAVNAVGPNFYNHGFLDDQNYHATVQDFNLSVRYQLLTRPLLITPFVALGMPSHDYAYVGEASPGRNLKEFQFGTDVARQLDPFLPKAYVQGQFSFAIPEESLNIRTTRSNISLELGYFFTRKFAAHGFGDWQHTYNGLQFPEDLTTPEIALTHERLLKASFWHLGAGIAYDINRKTTVSLDTVYFLTGSNTHYGSAYSVGITRSFDWKLGGSTP